MMIDRNKLTVKVHPAEDQPLSPELPHVPAPELDPAWSVWRSEMCVKLSLMEHVTNKVFSKLILVVVTTGVVSMQFI